MTNGDSLIHDLSDRLNSITISVELSIRLLKRQSNPEVLNILERVRDDCGLCSSLLAELREQSKSG